MLKLYNGLHIWINTEHEAWLWGSTVPSVTRPSVQSVAAVEMNYWSGLKSPHETWRAAWISGSGPERLQGTNELCVIIAPSNHLSPFKSIKIVWKMTLSTRHTLIPTLLTVAHTPRFTWLALHPQLPTLKSHSEGNYLALLADRKRTFNWWLQVWFLFAAAFRD